MQLSPCPDHILADQKALLITLLWTIVTTSLIRISAISVQSLYALNSEMIENAKKILLLRKYLQNANIFADPLNYLLSGFQRPICGSLSGAVKICPPRIRRFLKGKFILSGLCAVRGAGCEPVGNLFNNRQTHNCTRVDHWPVWPQTGVSLSLEAPLQLDQAKVHESKFETTTRVDNN